MTETMDDTKDRLPFTQAEYDRRWEAVLKRIDDYGIDAVISTFGGNHEYLTGHGAMGSYAAPYYLIIAPGKPRSYVVREFDERTVRG